MPSVTGSLGAGGAAAQAGGDERLAARDGERAELRPVQPRPADLREQNFGYAACQRETPVRTTLQRL